MSGALPPERDGSHPGPPHPGAPHPDAPDPHVTVAVDRVPKPRSADAATVATLTLRDLVASLRARDGVAETAVLSLVVHVCAARLLRFDAPAARAYFRTLALFPDPGAPLPANLLDLLDEAATRLVAAEAKRDARAVPSPSEPAP